ncbi:MAG: hypothetical protein H6831_13565 [Planctomycetes bacterium]|nr:hypothetical protein [Planctomycetota bacterium]
MESNQTRANGALQRHLSNLKLVSRLLGHELHTQSSAKSITLSRDEVLEIQTTLDLFIEEATRRQSGVAGAPAGGGETRLVHARN